ncbi:zinc knuckle domain-containing protein [Besnoitia besnoiti]|uniref:Zinc knuckle domain-containing protein n=1 Tax=Besnoitia besnoiti TaxID=94643 RepID=A0A2A9M1U6_BESBE|nr:zinc knuckle domain-containing protein [Besnoitia besnoiti]PFH31939.1 zinc knuckle domain-containing protein [Besnoitia besnoiti]
MWSPAVPSPYAGAMQQQAAQVTPQAYMGGAAADSSPYMQAQGAYDAQGQASYSQHAMYSHASQASQGAPAEYLQTPSAQAAYSHAAASPYAQQGQAGGFAQQQVLAYGQQQAGGALYAAQPTAVDYAQQQYHAAAQGAQMVYGSPASAAYGDGVTGYYAQQTGGGAYAQRACGYSAEQAAYGLPPPVRPPADPELVKRIHTIAEYCCRNPEMEALVRQRDGADPRFAFINGGEGYDYFRFAVACLQQGLDPAEQARQAADPSLGMAGMPGLGGGQAQDNGHMAREFDIDSLIMQYQEPPEPAPLSEALAKELDDVVLSMEKQATSTAIRNGRHWIEVNGGGSDEAASSLAAAIRKRQAALGVFAHKLNVLYLVHDVAQNEFVHKKSSALLSAFKPYLVWMLRDAYQAAARDQGPTDKVEKILTLWVKRGIIDEDEQEEMSFLMTSPDLGRYLGGTSSDIVDRGSFATPPPPPPPDDPVQGHHARHTYMQPGVSPVGYHGEFARHHEGSPTPPPPPPRSGPARGSPGGGFDCRPDDLGSTPESIPVGMMATMLRSMSKRAKNMQTAFVPYRALDPLTTPQQLPPPEPPSDYLLDRIRDFYEDLEEVEEKLRRRERGRSRSNSRGSREDGKKSRSGSRSRSSRRSGSRSPSPSACLDNRLRERDRERRMREVDKRGATFEKTSSWVNAEMGVGDDGSFSGHPGLRGARLGLGAAAEVEERKEQKQQPPATDDPFEMFRRQRAGKYHDIIASNKAAARLEQQAQRFADKNCYLCGKVGHIARDCPTKTSR